MTKKQDPEPGSDLLVRGTDLDPSQNVMDPQHRKKHHRGSLGNTGENNTNERTSKDKESDCPPCSLGYEWRAPSAVDG
jgi:hypothetical protein